MAIEALFDRYQGGWSDDGMLCMCRGVCGYPRVLHGGFTAAYLDESLGLLFYALRQHGCLPFIGPAFTAHLEVDYKQVSLLYNSVALLYEPGFLEQEL